VLAFLAVGCFVGALAAVVVMQVLLKHRASSDAAAWILVANVNTLLRLDLDHLTGDDENHGLRELRVALKEEAAKRSADERKLLERFNALVGIAIAFGEKMHDAAGNVDLRAVANRRGHVLNALALGERVEAALGGIAELARDGQRSSSDQSTQKPATTVPAPAVAMKAQRGRAPAAPALAAIAAPASGARM
jgi:hypothetical protein